MSTRKRFDIGHAASRALLEERRVINAAQENLPELYLQIQQRIVKRENDFWQSVYRMTGFPDGDEGAMLAQEKGIRFTVDHAAGAVFVKCEDPAVLSEFFPHLADA